MLTINNFNRAISSIQEDEFDSHKFIKHYIKECEHEYISMLIENFNDSDLDGAFRNLHSQIGRFLSLHQEQLNIVKLNDKSSSENIKGDITPNAQWKKL